MCRSHPAGGLPLRLSRRLPIAAEATANLSKEMAGVTGLEPATSGVTGRHSNQLSYTPGPSEAGRRGGCEIGFRQGGVKRPGLAGPAAARKGNA